MDDLTLPRPRIRLTEGRVNTLRVGVRATRIAQTFQPCLAEREPYDSPCRAMHAATSAPSRNPEGSIRYGRQRSQGEYTTKVVLKQLQHGLQYRVTSSAARNKYCTFVQPRFPLHRERWSPQRGKVVGRRVRKGKEQCPHLILPSGSAPSVS